MTQGRSRLISHHPRISRLRGLHDSKYFKVITVCNRPVTESVHLCTQMDAVFVKRLWRVQSAVSQCLVYKLSIELQDLITQPLKRTPSLCSGETDFC